MRRVLTQPINYDEALLRETQPYKSVQLFLREVVKSSVMAILEGEPGTGKTWGALTFAKKRGIPFITTAERVVLEKSPSRFFRTIVTEITGREPMSLWDALDLLEQWALNGDGRAIFIDEAQWMTGKVLDVWRRLHDMTGCTILLIGHLGEVSKLLNRYPQAKDRIAMRFVVPPLSFSDLQILHGNDFSDEVLSAIYEFTMGNFRRLKRVVEHLTAYAQVKNKITKDLTVADFKVAVKFIATW